MCRMNNVKAAEKKTEIPHRIRQRNGILKESGECKQYLQDEREIGLIYPENPVNPVKNTFNEGLLGPRVRTV
jgi:hypothetical protein